MEGLQWLDYSGLYGLREPVGQNVEISWERRWVRTVDRIKMNGFECGQYRRGRMLKVE